MLSKLRQSLRRKSSILRRHRQRRDSLADSATDTDTDTDTVRPQSVSSSLTSLNSSVSVRSKLNGSAGSVLSAHRPTSHPTSHPDSQWQRATPSVLESNRTMFNRQLNCDVIFVVGGCRALIGAHRFVLLSRSDVFFRMFCGPMAEGGPIEIPDVTEDVFRQILE